MDDRYDTYCAVDPMFYDSLTNTTASTRQYAVADRPAPGGWDRALADDWVVYGPRDDDLPLQGWKVHVSACLDNAERILTTVWQYCVPRGIGFKFLRGPQMLLMRNAKYAARGSSGKFVTVYPHGEAELERVCAQLGALLAGEPGPYVLSDLRYGDGPVYVRYGSFAARYCLSGDGQVVPAIADPDGNLVPDQRGPVFTVPPWIELPGFLAGHLAARNATTTAEVPYRVERVMHFSNGGGLYAARDTRTGAAVVLKEARPYAGLDGTGVDAVTRLHRERDMLRALAGLPWVPRVHDAFPLGEHEFLALEYVEGTPLNRELVARYPLTDPAAGAVERAAYTTWARHVYGQVERAIADIHARGIVYGDLHLFNVLVRPDERVVLVDFEVAAPVSQPGRPALRNQGFAAPRDRTGFAVDEYALACLKLALFLPLTSMLRLVPAKAAHLAEVVAANFPVPRDFLADAVRVITGRDTVPAGPQPIDLDAERWPALRGKVAGAILHSASPLRTDRLFPGDIEQFHSGGLSLGYGAAGVLWALWAAGAGRYPEHERWLLRRALNPVSGTRCGFYDGLHGVAYALHCLGYRQEALDVLDICLGEPWYDLGIDLASGLAGVGLNLSWFAAATGEPVLAAAAGRAADLVAGALLDPADPDAPSDVDVTPLVSGGQSPYAGLTRGGAGPALLFLRRFELTGDPGLLDHAATALRRDLRRCQLREDGALEVNEGWRTMPYLAHGSTGIGLALDQYLAYRPDEELGRAAAAIRRAAASPFYAQSGLFAGRAGIIAYLASRLRWQPGAAAADRTELAAQVR
ncbi:MAG TPA: class III lanthionine synthetase LanKC, partial [Rugosimonospora sp.]|nr:class III lanthionine synthetase LanKC [Rugosimonospora sp.]